MLLGVFLKIRLGLWVFWEKDHGGKVLSSSYHVMVHTTNMTVTADVDLDHLGEAVFVSFSTITLPVSPRLSILSSLEGSY